ncbi:hypothetical protein LCGC14_1596460, partial [marine sediment metagenome]
YVGTDGLKANEKILLDGLRKVKENDTITAEFVKPETVMAQLDLYAE